MPTVKPTDFVCYMQVVRDDFFLYETCKRIFEQGVRMFYFHIPVNLWNQSAIAFMASTQ